MAVNQPPFRETTMQPYKICCLTYKQLDRLVKETIDQHRDPELDITIVEGLQEEVVRGLAAAESAGCEVAVGGGANARIAREFSSIPVLEYRITAYDYLGAFENAAALGDRLAVCSYRTPIEPALLGYLEKRGIGFVNIIYETDGDLGESLRRHPDAVVVGAAHANDIAERLERKHVLIYPGQASVLEALREAKALAEQLRRQSERSKYSQAVVENSANGIVLVDAEGVVVDFNQTAQQIFGRKASSVKGGRAESALPESGFAQFRDSGDGEQTSVRAINGEDTLCKWVRLSHNAQVPLGVVGIFSSMSDIVRAQIEHQHGQLRDRNERGFAAKMHFRDIIGSSPALKAAKNEAHIFARSDASILIQGETGVGKEIFAQSIHNESGRKNGPFIAINCAALPENLLESELFGYDEGAFTGGRRGGKKGLFELAGHGSIFLDEICELSPSLQSRLLRVLQEREIMHVGGDRVIPVDVRVLAATNKNLEQAEERFRKDLYYRLSVLELSLPPLRERDRDACELFTAFLRGKSSPTLRLGELPPELERIIGLYRWPGNIRELQNVCERFSLYLENNAERSGKFLRRCLVRAIGEERLLADILAGHDVGDGVSPELVSLLQDVFGFNKTQVGEKLGLSRTTLWRMGK